MSQGNIDNSIDNSRRGIEISPTADESSQSQDPSSSHELYEQHAPEPYCVIGNIANSTHSRRVIQISLNADKSSTYEELFISHQHSSVEDVEKVSDFDL